MNINRSVRLEVKYEVEKEYNAVSNPQEKQSWAGHTLTDILGVLFAEEGEPVLRGLGTATHTLKRLHPGSSQPLHSL
jgi:hypothetical protein